MASPFLFFGVAITTAYGWAGPHNVLTKGTWDYKGSCGPGTVYYPEADGNFPLLSFAHGMGASGTKVTYSNTIFSVASWGYIVVALEGCETSTVEYKAQEAMMDWAFSHWSTIDRSKPAGIFGHSMGGGSTMAVAGDGNACQHYGLQGAFMMHPCMMQIGSGGPSWIPSLYVTGSEDWTCRMSQVYGYYKQSAAHKPPRGYGVYKGYSHTSPCGPLPNLESIDIANWMGCYLYGNQNSCGSIYDGFCGDGKKIATGQSYGCELFMNGAANNNSTNTNGKMLWQAALATGDPLKALAVPWGLHDGSMASLVEEIKRRGDWIVAQREKYLRARGLYSPNTTQTSHEPVVV